MAREKIEKLKQIVTEELAKVQRVANTSHEDFKMSSQVSFASPSASGDRYFAETQAELNRHRVKALEEILKELRRASSTPGSLSALPPCYLLIQFDDGEKHEFFLLDKQILLPNTRVVSTKSIVGEALVGKKAGDVFSYKIEDKKFSGKVLSIE